MSSIFTKIIQKEIPGYIIHETDEFIAFLDVFPLVKGHTLVVPKAEIDYIFNIENDLLAKLHVYSKKIAKAIEKAIPCERIGIAVIGLEVPHTHIHLVPLNSVADINFERPKLKLTPEELNLTMNSIKKML